MDKPEEKKNTKQDIRDAADRLHDALDSGTSWHAELKAFAAAMRDEFDRQLAFDAKRAAAVVPAPSSPPPRSSDDPGAGS